MKESLYNQALSGLDEHWIEEHLHAREQMPQRRARRTRRMAASAACTVLVAAVIGIGVGIGLDHMNVQFDEPVVELGDVVIPYDTVAIHYIAPDGHAAESKQYLPCDAYSIFAAWRTQNRLPETVELIQTHTASNGVESYEWIGEYEGEREGVVSYRPGDKFYLTITIKGLEPHLAAEGGDALLESLKQTLSGYTNLTYERVEVVFEE